MTPEETINAFVRSQARLITGVTVIRSAQYAAPRPVGAYGDVAFVSDVNQGWEQNTYFDGPGDTVDIDIEGMRELSYTVSFYRIGAIDNARMFRTALTRESISSNFRAANLGVMQRSEVRNIPEPLESGFEQRANVDITISAVGTDQDIVNNILSVSIAGVFEGSQIFNQQIEVA